MGRFDVRGKQVSAAPKDMYEEVEAIFRTKSGMS